MNLEITQEELFKCDICDEETEFKGYYNHTTRKMCPNCAVEEVLEIVNHN